MKFSRTHNCRMHSRVKDVVLSCSRISLGTVIESNCYNRISRSHAETSHGKSDKGKEEEKCSR